MTIDPDVRGICASFAASQSFARLVQAVVNAEGGGTAIIRAVQCSEPSVQTREQAIRVVCRSAIHAMSDFLASHDAGAFITFWGQRWAPVGVANDPTNLNKNWSTNVKRLFGVVALLLLAMPLWAQPSPEDIVQRHRESYGERVSPADAPTLLRAIAGDLTQTFGTRYGLLVKQSGNNCGGFACDIICDANKDHWDVFRDGPDASEHYAGLAVPSWHPNGSIGDRTCALVDAAPTPPSPPEPPPAVDLTPLEHAIDALTTRIAEVEAQLASVQHDVTSVRDDLETRSESVASAIEALAARPTITTCHASAFGIPIHCEVK